MKRSAFALRMVFGLSVTFLSAHGEDSLEAKHSQQKTSAQFGKCPDGHAALKDIPIQYGLPIWEKLSEPDNELGRKLRTKDVVLGGCIEFPESPKFQVTCLKCDYHYDVMMVPDIYGQWIKDGEKLSDFKTPFSAPARTLPFLTEPGVSISVSVIDKKVVHEIISVTVLPARKQKLLVDLEAWIASNHFDIRLLKVDQPESSMPFDDPPAFRQKIENGEASLDVTVTTSLFDGKVSFGFSVFRKNEK